MSGYKNLGTNIYSLQENYLDTVDAKYYLPNEFEQEFIDESNRLGIPIKYLPNGKIDPISLLYSDVALNEKKYEDKDPYDFVI